MVLNDSELEAKVRKHCGKKIDKGEEPCEYCRKKLSTVKSIRRQKDYLWKLHDEWKRTGTRKSGR